MNLGFSRNGIALRPSRPKVNDVQAVASTWTFTPIYATVYISPKSTQIFSSFVRWLPTLINIIGFKKFRRYYENAAKF